MDNYSQEQPSQSELTHHAYVGGIAAGSGIALLIFKGISAIPVFGQLLGIGLIVAGIVLKKRSGEKQSYPGVGLIVLGALAFSTIIPGIRSLTGFVLVVSALGLIGFGAWKMWGYVSGLRGRKQYPTY